MKITLGLLNCIATRRARVIGPVAHLLHPAPIRPPMFGVPVARSFRKLMMTLRLPRAIARVFFACCGVAVAGAGFTPFAANAQAGPSSGVDGAPAPALEQAPGDDGPATQDDSTQPAAWSTHGQATYVWQHKDGFSAPYSGPHSLITAPERDYSVTATLFLGARLWNGAEFYVDPEAVQGLALSNLYGLGGIQNGELQKNGGQVLRGYLARVFLRQTIGFGGELQQVDDGQNQLAGSVPSHRLVLTIGKLAQTDLFERSASASDPRSQFLNWSLITHGAWDFAADARGYSIGAAAELDFDAWSARFGRFMEPSTANGKYLDYQIARYHGDTLELEHDHELGALAGAVRLLYFRNVTFAGSYQDAINQALGTGVAPNVMAVRRDSVKTGFGVSIDQALSADLSLFLRASSCGCRVEEYAYAEIDNSVTSGLALKGTDWARPKDVVGLAFASNGLNPEHRAYLAAGGLGGFLGDGNLNYAREDIVETYYNAALVKGVNFSFDFQRVVNPGYNADRRGPVTVFGARLHFEL